MPSQTPVQPPVRVMPATLLGDAESDTLDSLVSSSRRLGRFWPPLATGPEPASAAPVGVRVPSRAQLLVAGMAEYGS